MYHTKGAMKSLTAFFLFCMTPVFNIQGTTIRLAGGKEGRLEIFHDNQWGTVCDDPFHNKAAELVCTRMLKISWNVYAIKRYVGGSGPVWLDRVKCYGNETYITECEHNPWGTSKCGHGQDVGMTCKDDPTFFRLDGGPYRWEGEYQIYKSDTKKWRSFCSDSFGTHEAQVACRSMNFSANSASVISSRTSSVHAEDLYNVLLNCSGNEKRLLDCSTNFSRQYCPSGRPAAVFCGGEHSDVRLVNGNETYQGKLQVRHNGIWDEVCDIGFDESDAKVVCRMLGYFNLRAVTVHHILQSMMLNVHRHFENISCDGTEADLNACKNVQYNSACTGGNAVGITCYATRVRLSNGTTPFDGRVEVFHNGEWGTVCDNDFDSADAQVVCRMIGANTSASVVYSSAWYGQGTGKIFLDDMSCTGHEKDIAQCNSRKWNKSNCGHEKDVSVKCLDATDFDVRMYHSFSGQLLIKLGGKWGTTSYTYFTPHMADAFCRYSGFNESSKILKYGGELRDPPIWNLQHLFGYPYQQTPSLYNHNDDVGIICKKTAVRLVGSSYLWQGRAEVQYHGVWGAICCDGFTRSSGDVICKELGYKGVSSFSSNSRYGQLVNSPMWVKNLRCSGKELDISRCPSDKWQSKSCSNSCNIGLVCARTPIRLVNGSAPFQGRAELYHNGSWGTVSSTNSYGAKILCQQMGYNISDVTRYLYDNGLLFGKSLHGVLPYVDCFSDIMDIEGCIVDHHITWSNFSQPSQNVGLRCLMNVRLQNGPGKNTGRVEINRNGIWGTLCSVGMTAGLATEICKMLAPEAHTWHMTGKLMTDGFYGKGQGPIWKLKTGCTGDIATCLLPKSDHLECSHDKDVAVYCISNLQVRLSGGHHPNEGAVQLLYNDEWVGLCDLQWDRSVAAVVCRSIGYWINSSIYWDKSWFGQTTNQLWNLIPYCFRNDHIEISSCKAVYYGERHCTHSDEVAVKCISSNLGTNGIRLVNGPGPWRGMLSVKPITTWGGVCWNFWNSSNADVVCRTLQYKNTGNTTAFRMKNFKHPLYIKELNCTGNETDIGMCKGSFDVYQCNDNDAVGIDCSGGMKIRLQNGTNMFEGRIEINTGGQWRTVCDTHFSLYDAKAICSSIGVSFPVYYGSTTTVLSNSYFGNGNITHHIYKLGCSGLEDHIGQCTIQENGGSCSDNAGVRCVDCVQEFNSEVGEILSTNYPSYFYYTLDCIYIVKPRHLGNFTKKYVLTVDDLRYLYDRIIEIREGYQGQILSLISSHKPTYKIVGREFFIRYSKDSGHLEKLKISWKPLEQNDAVDVQCGTNTWDIAVNMTILKELYPDSIPELIYFPDNSCLGYWINDTIFFSKKYNECRTTSVDNKDRVIYRNKLMYPEAKTPNPIVIRSFRWTVDVQCELSKINSGHVNFHPNEIDSSTHSNSGFIQCGHNAVTGSNKEGVDITFYKDPKFVEEIKGNPLQIHIGDTIYVKVKAHTTDSNYKMRLHSCVAKPQSSSSSTSSYPLIKDGCATDSTTKLLNQSKHETKFEFVAFEFQNSKDNVYVECNATFCLWDDYSVGCRQTCHTKRRAYVETGTSFTRTGRSSTLSFSNINQIGVVGSNLEGKRRKELHKQNIPQQKYSFLNYFWQYIWQ